MIAVAGEVAAERDITETEIAEEDQGEESITGRDEATTVGGVGEPQREGTGELRLRRQIRTRDRIRGEISIL